MIHAKSLRPLLLLHGGRYYPRFKPLGLINKALELCRDSLKCSQIGERNGAKGSLQGYSKLFFDVESLSGK